MFVDSADLIEIERLGRSDLVSGFTTNPTLMRQAGVTEYEPFAQKVLSIANQKPVSFEVLADDVPTIRSQAHRIASWGSEVYVKIPVCSATGYPYLELINELANQGVNINVTAVLTQEQIAGAIRALGTSSKGIVSVFAGRIADTGIDPVDVFKGIPPRKSIDQIELLWASPREILNLRQAESCGCDIITMTPALWSKLDLLGKDLNEYSVETVQMFIRDAEEAGYVLLP